MSTKFLYIIGPVSGPQKIGFSKNPQKRLKSLQTAHPQQLILHYTKEVPEGNVRALEKIIHMNLGHLQTLNEWFDITVDDAKLEVDFAFMKFNDVPNLSRRLRNRTLIL